MPVDPRAIKHREAVVEHLARAGRALELHQCEAQGPMAGNVSPWESREAEDFAGTLMAIWVWARHQALSGQKRFQNSRELAWRFVLEAGVRHLPETLGEQDYEAPFGCACLLRAALADREAGTDDARQAMADLAADALRNYLGADKPPEPGREFRDTGFLIWNLADYARTANEDRALRVAAKYADKFFGTKAPPPPVEEPQPEGVMFDFLSTSSTRVLACISAQGETPFLGAWLRERILQIVPKSFTPRAHDENPWNASVAWLLGTAYSLTHATDFLDAYLAVVGELAVRDADNDGAIGRDASFPEAETLPTWAWAAAMDALQAK
jgi:hypothetical protein